MGWPVEVQAKGGRDQALSGPERGGRAAIGEMRCSDGGRPRHHDKNQHERRATDEGQRAEGKGQKATSHERYCLIRRVYRSTILCTNHTPSLRAPARAEPATVNILASPFCRNGAF